MYVSNLQRGKIPKNFIRSGKVSNSVFVLDYLVAYMRALLVHRVGVHANIYKRVLVTTIIRRKYKAYEDDSSGAHLG